MTDAYIQERPETPEDPEYLGRERPILRAIVVVALNVVGLLLFAALSLWAVSLLGTAATVSQLENNTTGWSEIFFWGALVGGAFVALCCAGGVHDSFGSPPIWGVNTFLGFWLIIGWIATWTLYAIPVQHTVQPGEIRYTRDGTILTEGQTIAGNRREPTSLRLPLSGAGNYIVRIPTNDTDWVTGTVTLAWQVALTPELEQSLRERPPVLTDTNAKYTLDFRVVGLMKSELERLVRAEAEPGQTAIGEVSGWSRDQASVPMGTRLGLQFENNPALRPSWLRALSIQGVSIGEWNRQEPSS